jgi:multiple sugar transport system substrate-binding protein
LAAAGAASAVSVPALASCGTGSGSGDVTLKLVVADYSSKDKPGTTKRYWEDLVDAFEKDNAGIKINLNVLSWLDVDAKIAQMVKDGNPPDMAQCGGYADFAAGRDLYSVDQLLSIPTQANFVPAIAAAGEVHRVQYGLPFVSSSRLLFYNKKLFRNSGLNPAKAPRSWNDIRDYARAMKSAGVEIPYGLPLGKEEAQGEAMLWMLGNGGGYADESGSYNIDSRENIATFEWIRDNLTSAGLTNPSPAKDNRADISDAFIQGKAGMIFGHPTFMQEARQKGIDLGIAPRLPGKSGPVESTMGVVDWMMAFRKNGHRKEIGKFLDYVYQDDNVVKFAAAYDLLPVTTSGVQKMSDSTQHKDLVPFLDQLENAQFYPLGKTSWGTVNAKVKADIGKAVEKGGDDPRTVLSRLQAAAQTAANEEE